LGGLLALLQLTRAAGKCAGHYGRAADDLGAPGLNVASNEIVRGLTRPR